MLLYKHAFLIQNAEIREKSNASESRPPSRTSRAMTKHSFDLMGDLPSYKIGIIGCGQVGTMILTKLIEVSSSFNNMKIIVSTRQPHLLRPFKQEFGIETEFNNDRVFAECDIIFICVLPGQASEMFKDVRFVL